MPHSAICQVNFIHALRIQNTGWIQINWLLAIHLIWHLYIQQGPRVWDQSALNNKNGLQPVWEHLEPADRTVTHPFRPVLQCHWKSHIHWSSTSGFMPCKRKGFCDVFSAVVANFAELSPRFLSSWLSQIWCSRNCKNDLGEFWKNAFISTALF